MLVLKKLKKYAKIPIKIYFSFPLLIKEFIMFNKRIKSIFLLFLCFTLVGCNSQTTVSQTESEENSSAIASEEDFSLEDTTSEESFEESKPDVIGEFLEETDVNLETYTNYLLDGYDENAWQGYGIGDPFVMRYNGKYYLYSSTKDWNTGIKVWVSDDLVNWKYGGYCSTDKATFSAYAPEVTYYNGKFYMYTSPAGKGHYVLEASNPFGPFKAVTDNLGNSIDGHVFIDDNGKWYFYHAAEGDIAVKEMSSPSDLSAPDLSTGVSVSGGWTEGPMVIKKDGVYYLTYCGNHVWSKGYRIKGAVGSSPLEFTDIADSVLLLNTDNPFYGLGHSSTVLGPNMDTYYIVYHSFSRTGRRRMHVDALSLYGKDFTVLGPTSTPQPMPQMPQIYTYSSELSEQFTYTNAKLGSGAVILDAGGMMLTREDITTDKYTAEINLYKMGDDTGMIFSYVDENNYGIASLDSKSQSLTVIIYEDGEKAFEQSVLLPKSFNTNYDFKKLQSLSLKKDGDEYSFYFNGLFLKTFKFELREGKFGINATNYATVGYTAVAFNSEGSSLKEHYKPIEGKIPAITCTEDGQTYNRYGISYIVMKEGFIRNYKVNVGEASTYDVEITYCSQANAILELYKGGVCLGTVLLPSNEGAVSTATLRNVNLDEGFGVISFKLTSGATNVLSYTFTKSSAVTKENIPLNSYFYLDGTWKFNEDLLIIEASRKEELSNGKILYGSEGWGNYAIETNITFCSQNRSAGIIIRGKNPSLGGAGNDSLAGRYFFQGYYICFDSEKGVLIYKVNYERGDEIASFNIQVENNVKHTLRVEAIDKTIKIYLNGELLGEFEDNYLPFLNGAFGFTGVSTSVIVDNLSVEPISEFSK